ncbi:probable disease resistance protein RF9 [Amborella trichopoda]|uniref:NB-ARC domain-containing protein n=1 Tax=Amborella trichopoda TaxID=13333 RepID=U5DCU1_AMBTC|nr:probable disease resistance protein RF9 [Amborella trichopoda]ERN19242.1 hypothetical protein AMTR_s00061p00205330 [Amborella trichopoda]|eukprot:XP_006857775.3 probable disease resistance protein RF9 [Amborella trichopoda]
MAESVLRILLQKISEPLVQEAIHLYGIPDKVVRLTNELERMHAFLKHAEKIVAADDDMTKVLVRQIRDLAYEAEDAIDAFLDQAARRKRRGFIGCLSNSVVFLGQLWGRHQVGVKIEVINTKLDDISKRSSLYDLPQGSTWEEATSCRVKRLREMRKTSPLQVERDLVGIEEEMSSLERSLLVGGDRRCKVFVVGMGGVGKTTLVKKVYNRGNVKALFEYSDWVCVSQTYSVSEILRGIINRVGVLSLGKNRLVASPEGLQDMNEPRMKEVLHSHLGALRYLIVLDDIWDIHAWVSIRDALPDVNNGSRILITTRNMGLAEMVDGSTIHHLQPLPKEESWELFCKKAFLHSDGRCPEYLKDISHGIIRKCGGLPLALVVVGGLLSTKVMSSETMTALAWRKVLEGFSRYQDKGEVKISMILSLSYFDLPYYLKPCFLYLSAYPEDFKIRRTTLIQLWVSEGFIEKEDNEILEDVADDYLEELVNRNMIQVESVSLNGRIKSCVVHDLLHDLSLAIAKEQNFLGVVAGRGNMPSQRVRRLAFHDDVDDDLSSHKAPSKIRSFFLYDTFSYKDFTMVPKYCLFNGKLIRVLVLENVRMEYSPKGLGNLTHLSYLSFRGSEVAGEFLQSIRKLEHLEMLDLRVKSLIPCKTRNGLISCRPLPSLRHLYASWDILENQPIHLNGESSRCLQTLWIQGGGSRWIRESLGGFSQLRKLRIEGMDEKDIETVYQSIGKLKCLRSLTLKADGCATQTLHNLAAVSHAPVLLEKTELYGKLVKLPGWFGTLQYLTKLVLVHSRLNEDEFTKFQVLPQLTILWLQDQAYMGKAMHCIAGGFPRLEHLKLYNLTKLEEWERLEQGSMPCLHTLEIQSCPKLRMLPEGLQHIKALQHVRCMGSDNGFRGRVLDAEPHLWDKTTSFGIYHEWKRAAL